MLQHRVAADVTRIAEDGVALLRNAMEEVVVLAAPAVEAVGEAVDVLELLFGECSHPAEVVVVDEPAWERGTIILSLRRYILDFSV